MDHFEYYKIGRDIWKVQLSEASSCCPQGFIDELMEKEVVHNMLQIHPMFVWDLLLALHKQ